MSKKPGKLFFPVLLVGVLALTALAFVSARSRSNSESSGRQDAPRDSFVGKPEISTTNAVVQHTRNIRDIEAEVITIHYYGFMPREITRPQGSFILMVDDLSGLPGTRLQLDRETGSPVRQMEIRREEPDWTDELDLEPGQYVLREADHPGWACRIIITPR
jgi:hypothetical protein